MLTVDIILEIGESGWVWEGGGGGEVVVIVDVVGDLVGVGGVVRQRRGMERLHFHAGGDEAGGAGVEAIWTAGPMLYWVRRVWLLMASVVGMRVSWCRKRHVGGDFAVWSPWGERLRHGGFLR